MFFGTAAFALMVASFEGHNADRIDDCVRIRRRTHWEARDCAVNEKYTHPMLKGSYLSGECLPRDT